MVDCQIRPSDVTRFPIIQAMLTIPREEYVPSSKKELAYIGDHLGIGLDRFLLDPRILAKMLDALAIRADELVLDIGSGLGYSSAIIASMAEAVISLEEVDEFSIQAENAFALHSVDNAVPVTGPLAEGVPRYSPYDVITCQGGIGTIPQQILDQLKSGGRIGAVVNTRHGGKCRIGYKTEGGMDWHTVFDAEAPEINGFTKAREFVF
ncbi:MAG: protein-L-isoaspartate O-methyltransferase [Rhodobacteraceae bacterium]|nr:protein-L-isoaspartate O-methyltransferase [Paracoccaceae bacterium]